VERGERPAADAADVERFVARLRARLSTEAVG
jgi:hypothetical protein